MEKSVYCYCKAEIPLSAFPAHFATCPGMEESPLNQLISSYFPYFSDQSGAEFFQLELEFHLNRVKAAREQSHSPAADPEIPSIPKDICELCGNTSISLVVLGCKHRFCLSHVQESLLSDFLQWGELKCWNCQRPVLHVEIRKAVGEECFDEVLERMAGPDVFSQGEKVLCPCGIEGVFQKRPLDLTLQDQFGEVCTPEACESHHLSCYLCPKCKCTHCLQCQRSPYHTGWTCAEAERMAAGEVCRYCERLAEAGSDHCGRKECGVLLAQSCRQVLHCGHRCFGGVEDSVCSPCLVCAAPSEQLECMICLEKLSSAPIANLRCGHLFHHSCIGAKLAKRWTGFRISFGFAQCPICNDWAVSETSPQLCEAISKVYQLYQSITAKAVQLLQEDLEELSQVSDPSSDYFQQHEKYALDRFCFYECTRCKEPYFGGKKQCNIDEDPMHFQEEEMICLNCMVQAGAHECTRHGNQFMEYKCRFCCSIATWYCSGSSHYCEKCHDRMDRGDDLTKKRPEQLPRCRGRLTCPLELDHAENGKEFLIGCGLCRREQGFRRD